MGIAESGQFPAGPLPGKLAPPGGSAAHAVASVAAPFHWGAEALWESVVPALPGFTIEILPEIDSTNSELMRRAKAGLLEPTLVVAEHQTAGRGRLGRSWHDERMSSQPSALMFSLGLMLQPADWSGLSLVVGLAVAQSLHADLRLKWPNDVWYQRRKMVGILIETSPVPVAFAASNPGRYVVIGVGVNIQLPAAAGLATPPAGLAELWPETSAAQALTRLLPRLVDHVKRFEVSGFASFRAAFGQRDGLLGLDVHLSDGQRGRAAGVDENGALLVHTAGGLKKVTSSEVSVRPA